MLKARKLLILRNAKNARNAQNAARAYAERTWSPAKTCAGTRIVFQENWASCQGVKVNRGFPYRLEKPAEGNREKAEARMRGETHMLLEPSWVIDFKISLVKDRARRKYPAPYVGKPIPLDDRLS